MYSIAVAQRQPTRQATVVDLPTMIPLTREGIARDDVQERTRAYPGNYLQEDSAGRNNSVLLWHRLPTAGGIICRRFLGKVFEALIPSGQWMIHRVTPNPDCLTPCQPALFRRQMRCPCLKGKRVAEKLCHSASVKITPAQAWSAFLAARPAQRSGTKGRQHVDNVPTKESLWQSWTF
jgi:hypothetical protein